MPATRTEVAHFICIGGMDFYDKRFPETREMALIDGVPTVVYHEEAKKVRLYSSHAVPVDDAQRVGLRAHKDFGTYYVEVGVTEKKAKKAKGVESMSSEGADKPKVQEKEAEVQEKEVTTKAAALEMLASKLGKTGLSMRNSIAEIKAEAEAYLIDFPNL